MKKFMMMALSFGLASALWAASTTSFTYQAALRDEHGNMITNGETVVRNFHVKLRLWNQPASGELLWGRSFNVVADEDGLFNLEVSDEGGQLPDETPKHEGLKDAFLERNPGEIFVGLEVDGSVGEIVPRQRLLAVPYAAIADDVRGISGDIVADGNITVGSGKVQVTPDGFVQSEGSSLLTDVIANGDVTVGGTIKANGGLLVSGGTLTVRTDVEIDKEKKLTANGGLSITGGLSVDSVKSDLQIDSGKKLSIGGSDVVPVPVGGIIMWTKKDLPDTEHWAVCDGKNDTPDLRDRFVVGAGYSYSLGNTGGATSVTLTVDQMPSHSHQVKVTAQGYKDSRSNDAECVNWDHNESGKGSDYWWSEPAGGDQSHENRPPYYALYYIMRVK